MSIILEVTDLTKEFGRGAKAVNAVNGLSLHVAEGQIVAFLGPNGAGKTTTIKMVAGLIRPDSGSVMVKGRARALRSARTFRKSPNIT